jgi:hypothetical protein
VFKLKIQIGIKRKKTKVVFRLFIEFANKKGALRTKNEVVKDLTKGDEN